MVRRRTARESFGAIEKSAAMYSAFEWRFVSPGHDEFRCVPVLTSRSVVETIIGIRLKVRRCDCSFVFAVRADFGGQASESVDVVPLQGLPVHAAESNEYEESHYA